MTYNNYATINLEDADRIIARMRELSGPNIKQKEYRLKNGEPVYVHGDGKHYSLVEDKKMMNEMEQSFKKTAAADRLRAKLAKRQAERK